MAAEGRKQDLFRPGGRTSTDSNVAAQGGRRRRVLQAEPGTDNRLVAKAVFEVISRGPIVQSLAVRRCLGFNDLHGHVVELPEPIASSHISEEQQEAARLLLTGRRNQLRSAASPRHRLAPEQTAARL